MEAFHGKFYIQGEFREKYILVDEGIIREIKDELSGYDVTTLPFYIIPGGVDIHVHFRDPGETQKEDFSTGSASAIFGGTTTVCDMPNNIDPIVDEKSFREKLREVQKKSYVDFGLYQAASHEIVTGAIGQKIFLGKSTGGILTDIDHSAWADRTKVVHAELQSCLDRSKIDGSNLIAHDRSRPLECEIEALEKLYGYKLSKVHVAHLTSMRSIALAKSLGFGTEVTPHHILLNNSMSLGSYGKVNPPLRKKSVQQELQVNLNSTSIDVISSDHGPHTLLEKEDFKTAPSGIPGVETRIPLILEMYKKKFISMERLVSTLSEKPAEIVGINKGYIGLGFDADFVIVDLKEQNKIRAEDIHSKSGWTPFEDFDGIFPKAVYLRGQPVILEDNLVSPPKGMFLNGKK